MSKINIYGELHAATSEGIIADASLIRISEDKKLTDVIDGDGVKDGSISRNKLATALYLELVTPTHLPAALTKYSLSDYMLMKTAGMLLNIFYSVFKNGELYRLYLGETLIMKKAENGEQVTLGCAYPLIFPIIFA